MSDVTRILEAIDAGDPHAAERLLPLVYDELRQLAAARLAQEKPGQTLDATALVHEAYLRLMRPVGQDSAPVRTATGSESCPASGRTGAESCPAFANRRHFLAAAAEAMRRILIENARRRRSLKRGGDRGSVPLADIAAAQPDDALIDLDAALTQLGAEDPLAARIVELHQFAGLTYDQVAATLEITVYVTRRKWAYGRAWLKSALLH